MQGENTGIGIVGDSLQKKVSFTVGQTMIVSPSYSNRLEIINGFVKEGETYYEIEVKRIVKGKVSFE